MEELDYNKEFCYGHIVITRNDYECMPCAMNTSSLSDEDMYRLAKTIYTEMYEWHKWLENGDVSQDRYDECLWRTMELYGTDFGMTYYEDED